MTEAEWTRLAKESDWITATLRKTCEQARDRIEGLEAKLAAIVAELADMTLRFGQARDEAAEWEFKANGLKQELAEAERERDALCAKLAEVEALPVEVGALREMVRGVEAELAAARANLSITHARIADLMADCPDDCLGTEVGACALCLAHRDLAAAREQVRVLSEALTAIADDVCAMANATGDAGARCPEDTCAEPDDRCHVCQARAALTKVTP